MDLTIPTHSQSQVLSLFFHVQIGGKYLSLHFYGLLTANLPVLPVHPCTLYDRSVVASQAKCMFWLLTALKDDLFPERIRNVLFVIRSRVEDLVFEVTWTTSGNGLLKITRYTG